MSKTSKHALQMLLGKKVKSFLGSPRLLVFICPFILLAPIWLTGKVMVWGTPPTQFIPWWWQAWQTLVSGELPLWNPMLGMGAPLLANYQSALLYPPTWTLFIAAALGGLPFMAWGLSILVAAHLTLAGWGMLSLLAKLKLGEFAQTIGALAFSLSGFLVAHAQFISIHFAIAWLPWILLAAYELFAEPGNRRSVIKLATFFALQWLAGHAQTSWYTFLLVVAWAAFWIFQSARKTRATTALNFGFAALLGFLISSAQLLPTAEYLLESQRSGGVDRAAALFSSFWPPRFIGLVAPNFFGNPAWGNFSGYANYWEDAIYIGLIPLGLALVSIFNIGSPNKRRPFLIFLAGLVLVSFLLALGENTPVFPWLFENVPTFDMFRGPTRFSMWAIFALAVLAALAADRWKPNARSHSRTPGWQFLICGLLAADLLYGGWGLTPAGSPNLYKLDANEHAELRADLAGARLYLPAADEEELRYGNFLSASTFFSADPLALRSSVLPNTNLLDQIPSVNNYDPLLPARFTEWMNRLENAEPVLKLQLLEIMNVGLIEHVLEDQGAFISFERMMPLPRARWVNCAHIVASRPESFNLTFSGDLDLEREIAVESPDETSQTICGSGQTGLAELLVTSSGRVEVAVDVPGGGWLLLADTWYPGWVAEVNGEQFPLFPALGVMQAFKLSPGEYTVIFSYRPTAFYIGLVLSLAGIVASVWVWRKQ